MSEEIREVSGNGFVVYKPLEELGVKNFMTTGDTNMKLEVDGYRKKVREIADILEIKRVSQSTTTQVHGNKVAFAKDIDFHYVDTDGLIGGVGQLLTIKTADCVPIIIFDTRNRKVALVHSGWRGTFEKISSKAINMMISEYGTQTKDLICYLGSSISKEAFEVESDVIDLYEEKFLYSDIYDKKDEKKYIFDLKKLNVEILKSIGVKENNIYVSKYNTDDAGFHSYRRDGVDKYGLMTTFVCVEE